MEAYFYPFELSMNVITFVRFTLYLMIYVVLNELHTPQVFLLNDLCKSTLAHKPFSTHSARVSPVATVHTKNVSLHVGVPSEQFQADPGFDKTLT